MHFFSIKNDLKRAKTVLTILGIRIKWKNEELALINLLNTKIENMYYELKDNKVEDSIKIPKIMSNELTFNLLLNTDKSICRFGDGEFTLMLVPNSNIGFQKSSKLLSKRLKEVLSSNDENILVGIPNIFGSLEGQNDETKNYWRKYLCDNRQTIYETLDFDKSYANAGISRPYIGANKENMSSAEFCFDSFKNIIKNKNIVIVEGELTRFGVGNDLLAECKSVKRILVPAVQAFDKYDAILDTCLQQSRNVLFILAIGPTATVLAYDLAKNGYRAIDIGHIDIEYEWYLRKATKKILIENKFVNEVENHIIIDNVKDKNYYEQIIFRIEKKAEFEELTYTLLQKIFSVRNEYKNGIKRKIVTIFGIKMKFKVAQTIVGVERE